MKRCGDNDFLLSRKANERVFVFFDAVSFVKQLVALKSENACAAGDATGVARRSARLRSPQAETLFFLP